MNKSELILAVYEENQKDIASKAAAERIVNSVFDNMKNKVAAGEKVSIDGFGTIELVKSAARTGVNPQTGEKIKIPAAKKPKFKAAKAFKDMAAKSKAKV